MLTQTLLPYAPILGLLIAVMLGILLRGRHKHAH
jgi:hypothetical protein